MKKVCALFLVLACCVAAGCDKGDTKAPTTPAPNTTTPAADGAKTTTDTAPK